MNIRKISIRNLESSTAQEVFDFIAAHLLKQNKVSMDKENETCMYRGEGGLKCAAGCLFPDDAEVAEEADWRGIVSRELAPKTHMYLIQELQAVHDGGEVAHWGVLLKGVARDYCLKYRFDEE